MRLGFAPLLTGACEIGGRVCNCPSDTSALQAASPTLSSLLYRFLRRAPSLLAKALWDRWRAHPDSDAEDYEEARP